MADGDDAGVAGARAGREVGALQQGDPVAALRQVVGGADPDDPAADHDGVRLAHVPFLLLRRDIVTALAKG